MGSSNGFVKSFTKGLDCLGCSNVTFVLRDFQVLTGRIRGVLDERFDWNEYVKDKGGFYKDKECEHKEKEPKEKECEHFKKEPICCEPKVDVDVEIEKEAEFILLELTRPSAAASLSSVTCTVTDGVVTALSIVATGTTFPAGQCVAINVENIIYAGTGAEFCDIPITIIGAAGTGALTMTFGKKA